MRLQLLLQRRQLRLHEPRLEMSLSNRSLLRFTIVKERVHERDDAHAGEEFPVDQLDQLSRSGHHPAIGKRRQIVAFEPLHGRRSHREPRLRRRLQANVEGAGE